MIKLRKVNGELIVSLYEVKKLNTIFSERVKEELKQLFREGNKKVIFDLSGINFIDSSGFSMLKSINALANSNSSQFILCNISAEVNELLLLLDLQDYFSTCKRELTNEKIMIEVE
ncbi:MAG: STAS domain-containing protein [Bacteroidota bacterium]